MDQIYCACASFTSTSHDNIISGLKFLFFNIVVRYYCILDERRWENIKKISFPQKFVDFKIDNRSSQCQVGFWWILYASATFICCLLNFSIVWMIIFSVPKTIIIHRIFVRGKILLTTVNTLEFKINRILYLLFLPTQFTIACFIQKTTTYIIQIFFL